MILPIKFPDPADVIAEEAARFRALSPKDRYEAIRDLLIAGEHLMRLSGKAAFVAEYDAANRAEERRAIREFITRHAT